MAAHRRSVSVPLLLLALCAVSGAKGGWTVGVDSASMRLLDGEWLDCSRALIPVGARDVVFSCPAELDSTFRARAAWGRCSAAVPPRFERDREWIVGLALSADGLARFSITAERDSTARRATLVVAVRDGGACGFRFEEVWLGVERPGPDWTLAVEYRTVPRAAE